MNVVVGFVGMLNRHGLMIVQPQSFQRFSNGALLDFWRQLVVRIEVDRIVVNRVFHGLTLLDACGLFQGVGTVGSRQHQAPSLVDQVRHVP